MIVGGVLVAAKVEVDDENEAVENEVFKNELHGLISGFAGKTFQLRNTTVTFDNNTVFTGLTAADLANGLNVEVKGIVTGNMVLATTIKMEN